MPKGEEYEELSIEARKALGPLVSAFHKDMMEPIATLLRALPAVTEKHGVSTGCYAALVSSALMTQAARVCFSCIRAHPPFDGVLDDCVLREEDVLEDIQLAVDAIMTGVETKVLQLYAQALKQDIEYRDPNWN